MMSSKRATIAAAKSLKSISKVCSSGPLNSLKSLRNLSTAAERLDPASANGYHSENLSSDSQNANGLCYDSQNPSDFRQNLNPRSGFGKVPVGPDGNLSGYNGGNREGYGGEYQNRRAGDNANSHGFWEQRSSELQQSSSAVRVTTSTGFEENQSGVSPARFRNGFQQSELNVNGYASDYQSGVFAGGSGNGFQQSANYLDENSNSYQNQTVGHLQQYTDVANSSNFQRTGHVPSHAYTQSMHYPSNSYAQGFRESSGHPNGFYSQDLPSNRHGSVSGNYSQNLAGPQENIGQNMWNRGHFESEATSHCQPKAESSETSENTSHVSSIEEFDMFCGEGKVKEAVEVLALLENKGIPIDLPRYVKLMQLCGDNKAAEEAKAIHEHITRCTSPVSVYILNRILEMYSKCGAMDEASAVFDKMVERNLTTWDTMITGLANNGLGEEAIDIFTKFKEAGLKPDGQMFVSVFSACAVVGDAHEGMLHFKSMTKDYGIIPSMEHYVSAVDMLGKIGHLDEALEFIEKMPMQPGVEVWETLMNLCRIHGERELGDRCAELIGELDPSRLNEQSRSGLVPVNTSEMAKEEEKKKAAKKNLLEARSTVHEYRAGDTSHPETGRIYAQLRGLRGLMKEAGYVAETRFVLHDIDQESKEDALLAHSERLAVSYGLLSSPARSPIRVIKNLRVCGDCHNALKIMSKLVGREFIMRDAKRFHHFKDGVCSCRDYW